ncbi:raffinose/stachyose/melibiose transport system permease protein [Halogeometricum rufum]|uniref:Raffinose/stachyose/melibiose transport system permease protein n=1 Tax=Halogeometricum rufum TaxID=553469 RepID=A0A1I6IFR5_9EURY|nr:sugar ABC transporter permease [Halogeometricum rufum]SFR65494.1 raffinose/stachyose/melibiose transport system permease protein [Halogeometricum rufum]
MLETFTRIGLPRESYRTARDAVQEHWLSYLLFAPTLLFLLLVVWFPFLRGIWMSFHVWPAFGQHEWTGLSNYVYVFEWDTFWVSVRATLIYMSMTIIQFALALAATLSVRKLKRFDDLADGMFLIPYTMPPVVTGTIWLYILNPNYGPVFGWLTSWGILDSPIYWGIDGSSAITVVTLVGSWTFWQFMYLIFIASIQSIPDEHYETAEVYGANRLQRFRYVTLPYMKSAMLIAISLRIIRNLVKVSQPLQMTQGGPGYESSILAILLYRFTLTQGDLGLAFTVGVILFVLTIGFTFVFIREFRQQRGGEVA